MYQNCNYGHYLNIFDRLHGTYRKPEKWMFEENRRLHETEWKSETQPVEIEYK